MIESDPDHPIHLIINPQSGYGGRKLLLGEIRQEARRAGMHIEEYTTTAPRDATRHVRQIRHNAAAVIVWGGDGTANEIAQALAGTNVPMLPCPAGTENLLATELKVSAHPRRIIETLQTGQIVDCDIATVNDQNFLLILGVGFDGEVVRRLTVSRTGHISHLSYFWPIWRTFWTHDFPRMRVIVDGQEVFDDYGLAFVGNISRYAVGLRICRDAVFNDGLLDMVLFSCRKQTTLVLHAGWTLLRRHPLKGNVHYHRFRHARIETDQPVPSQLDGDVGPDTPLDITVRDQRIRLLIPRRPSQVELWPWKGPLPL